MFSPQKSIKYILLIMK